MSNVIVAIYKDSHDAGRAMKNLNTLIDTRPKAVIDICGIVRDREGSIELKQMFDRADRYFIAGLVIGAIAGFLSGLAFFGALTAMMAALIGALAGLALATLLAVFKDFGLNDDFIQKVGSELESDSAAILILHNPGMDDVILKQVERNATILQTHYGYREQQIIQKKMSDMLHQIPNGQSLQSA